MQVKKKKRQTERVEFSEEEIQSEIRKRILREAARKDGKETAEEATKATLDALEGMVSLPREKMERIAEEVRAEYDERNQYPAEESTASWLYPFGAILLIVVTFFLARRGSAWYLFTGLILLAAILNYFLRRPSTKDDDPGERRKDV